MKYRKEIDGLRALAVLPVIAFHAGFVTFEGGFVGVDTFFVISGYLISTIIINDLQNSRFSILNFYERRARRILPALFAVMAFSIPFAWLWMAKIQAVEFADSLVATSLFSSNILFWQESGYFAAVADEKPLLHTWSLAVEEQFYLIFPIIMILFWRTKKSGLIIGLATIAVVSMIVAEFGWRYFPEANFYLIFSRAWELMIGAFVAIILLKFPNPKFLAQPASLLGLGLLLFSIFTFDRTTPFPSLLALIPTVGTALIILFARPGNITGNLLSLPVFVYIGLFSYSAYLWHQPMFAFLRIYNTNEPSTMMYLVLSLLSLVAGWLSWQFIEQPIRKKAHFSRRKIFAFSVFGSATMTGLGLAIILLPQTLDSRIADVPPSELKSLQVGNAKKQMANCNWKDTSEGELETCIIDELKNPSRTVLVYGDSHAWAIFPKLSGLYASRNVRSVLLRLRNSKNCEYLIGSYRKNKQKINDDYCYGLARRIGQIANEVDAQDLYISLRYTFRLYPTENLVGSLDFDNGEGGVTSETPRKYFVRKGNERSIAAADKFSATLRFFVDVSQSFKGKTTLIGPVPEIGWDISLLNERMLLSAGRVKRKISTDYSLFKNRNKLILDILAAAEKLDKIEVFYPHKIFCDTVLSERCIAQDEGIPYYYDDDHLNDIGAKMLVVSLINR